ncbi:adenylate kinase [Colletotrichum kahawae]|uniref:Adenylate kinase n=1 Tax=Colletotrichum kahawae TaxID=34407 RepID=A0AAD9Y062_COLKA|nr:adenylate kinase [Colletotrichum kahawae]
MDTQTSANRRKFAVIFVLGAPGSGKGTICAFLAHKYSLLHFSVGDNLRTWMQANRETPLAGRIQEKLDHQGFLTSEELNPFLCLAIENAVRQDGLKGILIDGFPRCDEQLNSWTEWPFQDRLHLASRREAHASPQTKGRQPEQEGNAKPDVVLLLSVTKENAETRYLARGRDRNDSTEKFTKRYAEYLNEGPPVEQHYRDAGLLVEVDNNGSKEQNIVGVEKTLGASALWESAVVDHEMKSCFVV